LSRSSPLIPRELVQSPLNPSETLAFVHIVFDKREGKISGLLTGNSRSNAIVSRYKWSHFGLLAKLFAIHIDLSTIKKNKKMQTRDSLNKLALHFVYVFVMKRWKSQQNISFIT